MWEEQPVSWEPGDPFWSLCAQKERNPESFAIWIFHFNQQVWVSVSVSVYIKKRKIWSKHERTAISLSVCYTNTKYNSKQFPVFWYPSPAKVASLMIPGNPYGNYTNLHGQSFASWLLILNLKVSWI